MQKELPPGQHVIPNFDRFGLGLFAKRLAASPDELTLRVQGDVNHPLTLNASHLAVLPRVDQTSDFHCVTTWSCLGVQWSGVRFRDFYNEIVLPQASPRPKTNTVVFRSQDGYAACMQLEDLMAGDVLLADALDGQGLGLKHGGPLRLVAPAHYGYKNAKHIQTIEFWPDRSHFRFPKPYPSLMDHPRGRVALEERARYLPNWVIRIAYKALAPSARRKMRQALEASGRG
ncbi:MAG: molybdopterin-dependent oxidoreductase [Denitromonas halophila]|nr:MAG: molybdopterin-dependent oxidoreductase [Denitromonas halophila]TVT70550.1 MAG: molybdopterin-dependent oxidoreductase [Denitromonas halophila]TVT75672.1 MAG: molybdopterin-dependent oxidoreductase [Denitromonas halophila]